MTVWHPRDRLNGRTVKRLCVDRGLSPEERDRCRCCGSTDRPRLRRAWDWMKILLPDRHETAARVIFYKDRGENV